MSWSNYSGPDQLIPGMTAATTAADQVANVMASLSAKVDTFTASAQDTISRLSQIDIASPGNIPEVDITRPDVNLTWNAPQHSSIDDLGSLEASLPAAPSITLTTGSYTPADLKFTPSISGVNMPAAPAAIDVGNVPARPATSSVTLPDAPTIELPELPSMLAVEVPVFTFPELPQFSEVAPTFDGVAPNMAINWSEPTYMSESLTEVQATIKRIFAGGTGLPPEIEQQMFDRARSREDITARKAVAEAFDTFASRGFTVPPGMLVEQVNAVNQENQLKVNSLQRDLALKVADVEIENMKFAVQQGLAAENMLINLFSNAATRAFEVAKFTVEGALQLYTAQVSVYNATMNGYQIRSTVHKVNLDAELAKLEAYRVQMEGQKLIGEVNTQTVQAYDARVRAALSRVEIYKAQMTGAQTQAQVIASQIEAYRADVSAYGERIGAQKAVYDAYKSQVEGEVAKIGILDVDARVFNALVQAEGTKAETYYKNVDAQIAAFRANNEQYSARLDAYKAEIAAKMARVQARAQVEGLDIQYMTAQSGANQAKAEATIRIAEQQLQSNIAAVEASIKQFEVLMSKAVQEATLKSQALQAAGQMAATLAGGAMAAQHVQASISSSASESLTSGFSATTSATETWNYTPTAT